MTPMAFRFWNRRPETATKRSVRLQEAADPETPRHQLHHLYTRYTHDSQILAALATNPACCAGWLWEMAQSPNSDIREMVATNPSAPALLLSVLAQDPWPWVRWQVARNPACSPQLLSTLMADSDVNVALQAVQSHDAVVQRVR